MGVFARRRGRATPDHPENTSPPPDLTSLRASHVLCVSTQSSRPAICTSSRLHIKYDASQRTHGLLSIADRLSLLSLIHEQRFMHLDQTITTNPKCPFELSDSFRVVGRICKIYRRIN
ncbi:hypothetical protein PCASD_14066 [Puccinia coronata f. sp. avenae]|uniref:Uncharacterized protein n=1 Tax=Puccinia coronata f. sp. avenae TaxID=200324 RepID=A0A2N5TC24_9BASI|nr:hypothetical protein PCASD_14066 [Puccinia coronata f. sp. avenae]